MVDSRQYRSKFYSTNVVLLVLVTAVLVFLNLIRDKASRLKLDLSKDQLYSISDAAEKILGQLKDKITVTYHCSEDLGSYLQTLPRDTVDMFEKFRQTSGGKFVYKVVNPDDVIDGYAEDKAEEYMALKEEGKTDELEEPEPPRSPMSIFQQRQKPTAEAIRERRNELAADIAKNQKRPKDDVYRELLISEFKEQREESLQLEQIAPFVLTDRTGSSVRQIKIYSCIEVEYLDKQKEIIAYYTSIESLEYELCHRIVKLTTETKDTIAFFDGRKPPAPPFDPRNPMGSRPQSEYSTVIRVLKELYDVREVALKENDSVDDLIVQIKKDRARKERERRGEEHPLEEDDEAYRNITQEDLSLLKCLVIAQPDNLEDRQIYEINRAVSRGIETIFLVSPFSMDISPQGLSQGVPLSTLNPGLTELFQKWGLAFGTEVLASNESGLISIHREVKLGQFRAIQSVPTPLSIILMSRGDGIDQESPYTNKIQDLVFPASVSIKADREVLKKNKLQWVDLARTSEETWSFKVDPFANLQNPLQRHLGPGVRVLSEEDLVRPKRSGRFRDFIDPVSVAVEIRGNFPFTYEGENVPGWKKEKGDDDNGDDEGAEGDVLPNADDPLQEDAGDTPPDPSGGEKSQVDAPPASLEGEKSGDAGGADEPEPDIATLEPLPGKIVVLSSVDMLKNPFLGHIREFHPYRYNLEFFHNVVELFGLDDDKTPLADVRRKNLEVRKFAPGSDKSVFWIHGLNLFAVPFLVAAWGLVWFFMRRGASIRYERNYLKKHNIS